MFVRQSLVDVLEKLQVEHNETRDKFAELRRTSGRTSSCLVTSATRDQDFACTHAVLGEMVVVDTGGPLKANIQVATHSDRPAGLRHQPDPDRLGDCLRAAGRAARSSSRPKTATEASISDQSLAARVASSATRSRTG